MGIDALPPSLRTVSPAISHPMQYAGIKRSTNLDLNYGAPKIPKTTYNVDLESYYYGTIEGDISVCFFMIYATTTYVFAEICFLTAFLLFLGFGKRIQSGHGVQMPFM